MKKALIIFVLFILFLISYFIQSNLFSWFTIAGVKPNLFIVLVLCIGLFAGKRAGSVLGIIFGLLIDIFIGRRIGITGISLGLVGFLGGYLDKNFSKDSKITIILMCVGTTIIYELANYVIMVLTYKIEFETLAIIKILLIEAFFNSAIIIILYPFTRWLGYKVEDAFKGSNILTRYF